MFDKVIDIYNDKENERKYNILHIIDKCIRRLFLYVNKYKKIVIRRLKINRLQEYKIIL